jgi:hypothetical protein
MEVLRTQCTEQSEDFVVLGKGETVKVDARALE